MIILRGTTHTGDEMKTEIVYCSKELNSGAIRFLNIIVEYLPANVCE